MHFIWVYSCIGPNAFDILMSASVRPSLPRRVTRVTNKKQQLRNDIIDYLEAHNLTWCAQQVATEGERFVACLVDLMWYIDGHHEVFQHRSNAIPSSVSQFPGYNIPELSKHRKRSLQNMSSPILNDHANNIFKCLQGSYWMTNSRWNSWKGDLESQEDGHYKPFDSVYGTDTSEEHRPSLQKRPNRQKTLPFVASVQHARNTNLMVQCEECEMWRLVYSKYKLNKSEKSSLQSVFEDFTYTCGASLSDLDLSGRLQDVVVRDLRCYDPLEKLYYSLNHDPICIYCCSERSLHSPESCYPQCTDCNDKPNIKKRQ